MRAETPERMQSVRKRMREMCARLGQIAALTILLSVFSACSVNSAKKHYLLAEKLWGDGNYIAAVSEFDRATELDPKGKIGLQALFRSGTTLTLFLSDYEAALKKFELYTARSNDATSAWEAEKMIGDLFFTRLERYKAAIAHYDKLLRMRADAPEAGEFLLRMAKSAFFLKDFKRAIELYQQVLKRFPASPEAERATFELAATYFTRGDDSHGKEAYQEALDAYQHFLKRYPTSPLAPEARFGVASSLEEMDQLDAALRAFEALRGQYPSPKVIEIKITRLQERKQQRNR